eukprot:CAMPEP_0185725536 /NCGR_PEP_ID=MMETSP1171-20130828/1771_1 /TAXON_ID=374046 /ORGANISM="Helicotheca tamensis, Strain CCMP826" /LENGTH=214 /DNA_ID=CAMNT_0028393683 /DNA_START=33 /DNA_END=678 /DNA_ORIENTATION=+
MTVSPHPLVAKFEDELEARRYSLGNDHLDVAETLNALALANHLMTDNQNEALRCHKEALHIFDLRKGGPDYPTADVALTLSDIGNVHRKRGEYNDAANAYMKSVRTYRLCGMNDEHPRVHSVLMRLAQLKGFMTEVEEEPIETEPEPAEKESQEECPVSLEQQDHCPLSVGSVVVAPFVRKVFPKVAIFPTYSNTPCEDLELSDQFKMSATHSA